MKNKIRLDVLLVRKGLVDSREKAKALVMAGKVYYNNVRLEKPGQMVDENIEVIVKGEANPFVSRGGLKLAKAIEVFQLDFKDKVVVDIGSSTGGFTDCVLQNGAAKVYAVDVGYGQLHWTLRNDDRVINLERTNARYLDETIIPEKVDFVVCDVSFISITKIFPAMQRILKDNGQVIALIKPQFEAGKDKVGKNGVIKDPEVHKSVLFNVLQAAEDSGFFIAGLDFSPIRGPEGNIEFLLWLKKIVEVEKNSIDWFPKVPFLVQQAQLETE